MIDDGEVGDPVVQLVKVGWNVVVSWCEWNDNEDFLSAME